VRRRRWPTVGDLGLGSVAREDLQLELGHEGFDDGDRLALLGGSGGNLMYFLNSLTIAAGSCAASTSLVGTSSRLIEHVSDGLGSAGTSSPALPSMRRTSSSHFAPAGLVAKAPSRNLSVSSPSFFMPLPSFFHSMRLRRTKRLALS